MSYGTSVIDMSGHRPTHNRMSPIKALVSASESRRPRFSRRVAAQNCRTAAQTMPLQTAGDARHHERHGVALIVFGSAFARIMLNWNGNRPCASIALNQARRGCPLSAEDRKTFAHTEIFLSLTDLSDVCVGGQPKHAVEGCLAEQLFPQSRLN
jgi:hypothetical protein